jgi:hypothetical protein
MRTCNLARDVPTPTIPIDGEEILDPDGLVIPMVDDSFSGAVSGGGSQAALMAINITLSPMASSLLVR